MVSKRLVKAYELQQAFGFLYYDEIGFLAELADCLPKSAHIVNIGAGVGTSALTFLEARADIKLTTIDIRKQSNPQGALDNERVALEKAGFYQTDRYSQIHEDSKKVGIWWKEQVDMVFIDGEHSYENCAGDIRAWLPHVKDDGILAVHDYAPPWPQVRKAVDELLTDKYEHIKTVASIIAFRIEHDDQNST